MDRTRAQPHPQVRTDLTKAINGVSQAAAQGDSLEERTKALQTEQLAVVEAEPADCRYNGALASLVQSKQDQAARIEDRLESLIEQQASRLQQCQVQEPGLFTLPGVKARWQQQVQHQQSVMQRLHGRLEVVREIKDGMGLHGPRIEELAARKLRAQDPELASEWDELQQAQRLSFAHRRRIELELERERRLHQGGGQMRSLTIDRRHH